nr:LOW QUALITY PROTEIN: outer mitochondrial transmembrane helix translocase-like [Oncorhynchus gorbuscha]
MEAIKTMSLHRQPFPQAARILRGSLTTCYARAAGHQEVLYNHQVTHIYQNGASWEVCRKGTATEQFDAVVLTVAIPQILQLQGDVGSLLEEIPRQQLGAVSYSSRYALGHFYKAQAHFDVPWAAKYVSNNPCIPFIDDQKRNLEFPECGPSMVVHISVPFGVKHLEEAKEQVEPIILVKLNKLLPGLPQPDSIKCKKWRYSQRSKKMVLKEIPTESVARPLGRNEVIGLLFRLTIFGAVTYFTIKWMVDAIDPTRKQKMEAQKQAEKLMKQIGVQNVKLSEYEMSIAAHLVDPLTMQITWSDIAGLDEVITELKDTVILPIQKRHLFEGSRLLQPPKGVLLYGPPGCGKTLIAKATAKEAGFRFINLQPSTLTDKWYGESQKLAAAVFSLAIKLQPSIIFIDEIDSFLRSRSSSDHEATAMMKAQFMSLWDGLETDYNCQVIIMGATNRPQDLDSAILRRMPTRFHINQPNVRQREEILKLILDNENVEPTVDFVEIAKETDGFSGSDLRELCRDAALLCVRDFVHNTHANDSLEEDCIRSIQQQDMQRAIQKMRKSKSAGGQSVLMHAAMD